MSVTAPGPFQAIKARIALTLRARRFYRKGDPELRMLSQLARPGLRSVDIGANRGVYTYWLARLGATEAFEPNPDLAASLYAARLPNVRVHAAALSHEVGEADLVIPRHRKRSGLNDPAGSIAPLTIDSDAIRFRVPLRRLDDFAFSDIGFIKVDVEGHEEGVLDGAWQTITSCRPTLALELEERLNPGCRERVAQRFAREGYRVGFAGCGSILPVTPGREEIQHDGRRINNFLFLPEERSGLFQR